jgi:hypothetical protein
VEFLACISDSGSDVGYELQILDNYKNELCKRAVGSIYKQEYRQSLPQTGRMAGLVKSFGRHQDLMQTEV